MSGDAADLAKALLETPTPAAGLTRGVMPAGIVRGVVQAVDTSETPWTVSVTLAGSNTQIDNVGYLVSGYTPTIGDNVTLIVTGSDYLVIGSQGPGAGPGGGGGGGGSGPGGDSPADIVFRADGVTNNTLTLQNSSDAAEGLTIAGQASAVVLSPTQGGQLTLLASTVATSSTGDVDVSSGGDVNIDADLTVSLNGTQVVFSSLSTAPVLSELNPTDFAIWLDPTPGATNLNVVAKDSNGLEVDMVLSSSSTGGGGGDVGDICGSVTTKSAPWLLMNGGTYSAVTYPTLNSILVGLGYASGHLPNAQGLTLMGAGANGITLGTRDPNGESEQHQHTITHTHNGDAHTHTMTHSHSHSHKPSNAGTFMTGVVTGSLPVGNVAGYHLADPTSTDTNAAASSAANTGGSSIGTTGGSSAANTGNYGSGTANVPPNLGINWYILAG